MQQVEQGAIMLSRPVADYLPAFATRGKEVVTIRHLLAHSSGLPDQLYFLVGAVITPDDLLAEICQQPLVFRPGTRSSYCTWGFIVLAEILRVVTGLNVEDLGRTSLFEPLGMVNTSFSCRPDVAANIVPVFDSDLRPHATLNRMDFLTQMRGDTGALSTTDDLRTFADMMLNGGRCGNRQILSPITVGQMTENQYAWGDTPDRLAGTAEAQFATLSKGLGWMVRGAGFFCGSERGQLVEAPVSRDTFVHLHRKYARRGG